MPTLESKQKILIIGYLIILIAIPLSTLLVQKSQIFNSSASGPDLNTKPVTSPRPVPANNPSDLLKGLAEATAPASPPPSGNVTFGPVLNISITIEGRPAANQAAKVFVGIAAGAPMNRPSYLLSFTIDFPATGIYKGLSVAGLAAGTTYTTYIKGPAQLATASAFVATATEMNLNNGQPLNMLSGDLNADNVVNSADYAIALNAYGSKQADPKYSDLVDFNLDGVINNLDLAYIKKNFGMTGISGPWVSSPAATGSAQLPTPSSVGGISTGSGSIDHGGYWLWLPPVP